MQLYNCKVRLHGSLYNEVRKDNITAAEIAVLKIIHGQEGGIDAVTDIEHTGRKNSSMSDGALREYLNEEYAKGLAAIESVKSLNGVFGVMGALPKQVEGVEHVSLKTYDARKAKAAAKSKPVAPMPDDIDIADDADLAIPAKEEDEFA